MEASMSNSKVYAVVLAGGVGSRMGQQEKPKQYLEVGNKPIIIHTLEKFYIEDAFECVIVPGPAEWVSHTKNLVKKYIPDPDRVHVIEGGATRNETIMNSIAYIEEKFGLDEDTIIKIEADHIARLISAVVQGDDDIPILQRLGHGFPADAQNRQNEHGDDDRGRRHH